MRKKMAKVQRRKLWKGFREKTSHRTIIYKHLINNEDCVRILNYLSEGFERNLFLASLNNLSDKGNPLRFNNFAYCMREIITIILQRHSSDQDIPNCCWYKNETDKEKGITRVQRVKYSIQGGLSDQMVLEIFGADDEERGFIDDPLNEFSTQFRELNEHTHLREKRFNIGDDLCESLAFQIFGVMTSIFTLIENLRRKINVHIEKEIDEALLSEFVESTFDEIDILSTHSVIDETYLDHYYVESINSKYVVIRGFGKVYCELQWGSNSDMRNDIGASSNESFPYDFTIHASLTNLKKLELGDQGIVVDTRSWYV